MKSTFLKILLLIFIVFNIGLGSFGLSESSEARYAEISREMVKTGDFLTPNLLGINHYHKPPITYHITAIGYKIFGINEYGARFFLGIALILQIYLIFRIGKLLYKDEKIAVAAALIYLSFPIVIIASRNLTTDAYLITFILWSLYLWLQNKVHHSKIWIYAFYMVLGFAFLTKGPVAILPVIIFIATYLIVKKERIKLSMHDLFGIIIFVAISASWFIAIIIDNPKLWNYFIEKQIVERATNAEKFHRSKPFWYYLLFAPLLGFPWVFFIISSYFSNFKQALQKHTIIKIVTIISLLIFVIFSAFSSKLILYIIPMYPFLALTGGYLLYKISDMKLKWFCKVYEVLLVLLLVGLVVTLFIPSISMDLIYSLPLIVLVALVLLYFIKFSPFNGRQKLQYLGVAFIACLMLTHTIFSRSNPYTVNSVKELVSFVKQKKGTDLNRLIVFDYLLPSAAFYLDQNIVTVHNKSFPTIREIQFEEGEEYKKDYIDLRLDQDKEHFERLMNQNNNVLIERAKHPMPDSLRYLLKNYKHEQQLDKWIVHY